MLQTLRCLQYNVFFFFFLSEKVWFQTGTVPLFFPQPGGEKPPLWNDLITLQGRDGN